MISFKDFGISFFECDKLNIDINVSFISNSIKLLRKNRVALISKKPGSYVVELYYHCGRSGCSNDLHLHNMELHMKEYGLCTDEMGAP